MAKPKRAPLPIVQVDKNPRSKSKRKTAKAFLSRKASPNVISASGGNFFSFQLGTDFLEKPQNLKEKRAVYRYLAANDEFVNRALELKVSIPLSKLRLGSPGGRDNDKNAYILDFFERLNKKIKLSERLANILYEYYLHGVCYIFTEEVNQEEVEEVTPDLEMDELDKEIQESLDGELKKILESHRGKLPKDKYDRNPEYQGWGRVIILPPDAVEVTTYPFSDRVDIKVIPPVNTQKTSSGQGMFGDSEPYDGLPKEIQESIKDGRILLDTDPNTGSFVHTLKRGGSYYDDIGISLLDPILGTLIFREKLRQAQTSIASRHMTPIRVIWGDKLSSFHVDDLRNQVDMALQDPDYSIIANYEINWQEYGSNERLMDLTSEYDETEKRMMVALGFTSEILRGEGTYAGNRLNIEIINTEFMAVRQILSDFVEEYIYAPVARKKGFYEIDRFGNKKLLYPKLTFSRLALKDNQEVFGQLLDLYQKGAVPVSYILDLFNIDDKAAYAELQKDLFTPKDSTYNDFLRAIGTSMAEKFGAQTNVFDVFLKNLASTGVKQQAAPQEGGDEQPSAPGRFASKKKKSGDE